MVLKKKSPKSLSSALDGGEESIMKSGESHGSYLENNIYI